MTEEVLDATRALAKAVGHEEPISIKVYLDPVRFFTDKVQSAQREWHATTRQLSEKEGLVGELEMKRCLLAGDSILAVELKK